MTLGLNDHFCLWRVTLQIEKKYDENDIKTGQAVRRRHARQDNMVKSEL